MAKRKRIGAESLADDALRLRNLSRSLENRGLLLASDPRMGEAIADMRRELNRLRGQARSADYVEGDECLRHPTDRALTLCGETIRGGIVTTTRAHRVACAPCLRILVQFYLAAHLHSPSEAEYLDAVARG